MNTDELIELAQKSWEHAKQELQKRGEFSPQLLLIAPDGQMTIYFLRIRSES